MTNKIRLVFNRFSTFTLLLLVALFLNGCSSSGSADNSRGSSKGTLTGKASYYANSLHGNQTASGEIYNKNKLTCAHKTLAFGTELKVTNISNAKSVVVTVNDRGPFVQGRIIDLSYKAMKVLGGVDAGVIEVRAKILN